MLGALFSASGALMKFVLHPWQLLLLALAASLNRQQQQTIEYLITENQILKEKLVKKRILLNDNQRRRLAVKGKILGRKLLLQIAHIACPDTILRWLPKSGTTAIDARRLDDPGSEEHSSIW